jgi:uncharacterized protein GlcG (DUF336 family)
LNNIYILILAFVSSTLISISSNASEATHVTLRSLSAPIAQKLATAAYENCLAKGHHVAVAVMGRDGRLISFIRSPLAGPHTIDVSQAKAYTSATFKDSTINLMGRDSMRDVPGALIIGGGKPINIGGYFYGAIGVSGAPRKNKAGDVDDECAAAGITTITEEVEMGE